LYAQPIKKTEKQEFLPPLQLNFKASSDDGTILLSFNRKVEINPTLLEMIAKITNGKR
jgi:hypothetical protein